MFQCFQLQLHHRRSTVEGMWRAVIFWAIIHFLWCLSLSRALKPSIFFCGRRAKQSELLFSKKLTSHSFRLCRGWSQADPWGINMLPHELEWIRRKMPPDSFWIHSMLIHPGDETQDWSSQKLKFFQICGRNWFQSCILGLSVTTI